MTLMGLLGRCHDIIFFYYNSLDDGTPQRFSRVCSNAMAGSGVQCAILAAAGYLTFPTNTDPSMSFSLTFERAVSKTRSSYNFDCTDLLNNFQDSDILADLMRALYCLTMVSASHDTHACSSLKT